MALIPHYNSRLPKQAQEAVMWQIQHTIFLTMTPRRQARACANNLIFTEEKKKKLDPLEVDAGRQDF